MQGTASSYQFPVRVPGYTDVYGHSTFQWEDGNIKHSLSARPWMSWDPLEPWLFLLLPVQTLLAAFFLNPSFCLLWFFQGSIPRLSQESLF